jgi:hypothetical protein
MKVLLLVLIVTVLGIVPAYADAHEWPYANGWWDCGRVGKQIGTETEWSTRDVSIYFTGFKVEPEQIKSIEWKKGRNGQLVLYVNRKRCSWSGDGVE